MSIVRKIVFLILCVTLVGSIVGCGNNNSPANETKQKASTQQNSVIAKNSEKEATDTSTAGIGSKSLIVYFSMPETVDPNNMTQEEDNSVVVIDGKVLGNTQYVAMVIQEYTGGDIFRIEPKTPYTTNHGDLVNLAKKEQQSNARPALKASVNNINQYDTIYIGYPNWWGDMPMILYSFFDSVDLSGKTIIPFNTHGGSGFSDTINSIIKLEPGARVYKDGFTVSRNDVENSKDEVIEWLKKLH